MQQRNEVHLVQANNGHESCVTCWCEPNRIYWYKNIHGVNILVVEHNDVTLDAHVLVLARRERDRRLISPDYRADHNWITRALMVQERPREGTTEKE